MLATAHVLPGDILVVNTGMGLGSRMIRFGAAVKELVSSKPEPDTVNHVAILHHTDAHGVPWALEGRPGGIGWVDARAYISGAYTVTNVLQPKTDADRKFICTQALKLIGTQYDWEAIADDAAQAFGIKIPGWNANFGNSPGHLVCSSYGAYVYAKRGLAHPAGDRNVSPADWADLIMQNHWEG